MRYAATLFLGLLILTAEVWAGRCLPVIVRQPGGNYIVPGVKGDIVYRRVGGEELSLDAYLQPGRTRRPAVVVIHGGGWRSGSKIAYVGQFLELLTQAGYHWFSIDYRLGGPEKAGEAAEDLRAAVDFIRCHAREFRVDPERIMLLGEDAGAWMAATVAAQADAGIRGVALLGGLYESPPGANPQQMPATLVVHGTNDRESPSPSASGFCHAIKASGHACEYLPVEGAGHRPENWWPSQWSYRDRLRSWLNETAGGKPRPAMAYRSNLRKNIIFSPEAGLRLDAYVPSGRGPFPAVILVHGGGWEAGDKVTYLTPVMKPLAEAGFAWFSIDYRLTPAVRHEAQLADLRQAIHFVSTNARRFRLDPKRIAVLGESASGQMAALIAAEKLPEVAAVVSFYGVYDFLPMASPLTPRSLPARLFGMTSIGEAERDRLRSYSPLHRAGAGMAPLLLICGTKDGLYAQHRAFVEKLRAIGATFETIEIPDAPHGMENWEGHPEWVGYKDKLVRWLKSR